MDVSLSDRRLNTHVGIWKAHGSCVRHGPAIRKDDGSLLQTTDLNLDFNSAHSWWLSLPSFSVNRVEVEILKLHGVGNAEVFEV